MLPLAVAWILLGVARQFDFAQRYMPWPYWIFLMFVAFDSGHIYSTLFRTYFDLEEFNQRRFLYIATPVILLLIGVPILRRSHVVFFTLYMYFNIWHVIRQQYGWMMYASRSDQLGRFDRLLDKLIIYTVVAYPFIWWHFHSLGFYVNNLGGRFISGLPIWIYAYAQYIHWGLLSFYLIRQWILWRSGQPVNLAKHLIWFSTFLLFYINIVVVQTSFAVMLAMAFTHGGQYMYLVYRYGQKRSGESALYPRWFFTRWGYLKYAAFIVGLGALAFIYLPPMVHRFYEKGIVHTVLWTAICLPGLTHFALDGFIWGRKNEANANINGLVAGYPH